MGMEIGILHHFFFNSALLDLFGMLWSKLSMAGQVLAKQNIYWIVKKITGFWIYVWLESLCDILIVIFLSGLNSETWNKSMYSSLHDPWGYPDRKILEECCKDCLSMAGKNSGPSQEIASSRRLPCLLAVKGQCSQMPPKVIFTAALTSRWFNI